MAHLDDRGQLLLVAALVLSAAFVVLAIVVNAAIFAENLSTRNDVPGSHDALGYQAEVSENVGDIVVAVNENNTDSGPATLRDRVETSADTLDELGGLQQSRLGRVVAVEYAGDVANTTHGQRIAQDNASRNLSSADNESDWTLAEDIDDVRNVELNVTSDGNLIEPGGLLGLDDAFQLSVTNGSATWSLSVSESTLSSDINVTVQTPAGEEEACTRPFNGSLVIDVTGATVHGEPCHALSRLQDSGAELWLGTGVGAPFDIEFENGDKINGTYSMVVDGTAESSNVESSANDERPYATDAIYDLTLHYEYRTSAVGYESDIRVAPEEVPP